MPIINMHNSKRILAFIPARGGSKGIPHKNIIDLKGKPLISYTITEARKSKYIDKIMVSTDDKSIASVAKSYGAEVPFLRPLELASDNSKTIDAVLHTLDYYDKSGENFDTFVLLQPTQPLRTVEDIDGAIEKYMKNNCIPLVSVSPVDDHPLLIRTISEGKLKSLLGVSSTCRRQDMDQYYRVNGCIYINEVNQIDINTSFNDNIIPYIMAKDHSVDIDEYLDLAMAEYYLTFRK